MTVIGGIVLVVLFATDKSCVSFLIQSTIPQHFQIRHLTDTIPSVPTLIDTLRNQAVNRHGMKLIGSPSVCDSHS